MTLVRDRMTPPAITVQVDATVEEILKFLRKSSISAVPVTSATSACHGSSTSAARRAAATHSAILSSRNF